MSYQVKLLPKARKALLRLPPPIVKRIHEAMITLADEPRPVGCKKLVGHSNLYRVRLGDYRVIYEVQDHELTVLVIIIGHRRLVYGSIE